MIAPKPYFLQCENCSYSKLVKPKSDALSIQDIISICPKCGASMKTVNQMNMFQKLVMMFQPPS